MIAPLQRKPNPSVGRQLTARVLWKVSRMLAVEYLASVNVNEKRRVPLLDHVRFGSIVLKKPSVARDDIR
jgi:hypothetical protein